MPVRTSKNSRLLTRRTVLRGLLGGAAVSVALPPLEAMMNGNGSAYAEDEARGGGGDDGFPRRFGLFFWGNGNYPERWTPKATGPDWEVTELLAPLDPLRDVVTIATGYDVKTPNNNPHYAGAAGLLTGAALINASGDKTVSAPTIDQLIADELGEFTQFRSLEFGAHHGGGHSYNGPNSKNPPEGSPIKLFERLFGPSFTLPGDNREVDPRLGLRRSVLDAVLGDAGRLRTRVGVNDKIRIDQHMDSVRSLEKRLARLEEDPPQLDACAYPTEPNADYPDIEGRPQLQAMNKIFAELGAMALACDQTRVFSNWFTYPVSNPLFPGATGGHHQLTHDEGGDQPEVRAITLMCIEALAEQIAALAAIEEGDGTLLDHMVLLGTSEISWGKTHSIEDMPIVLAGSCGGRLLMGHHVAGSKDNVSRVMLTIARAVGVNLGSFGKDEGLVDSGASLLEL